METFGGGEDGIFAGIEGGAVAEIWEVGAFFILRRAVCI